MSYEIVLQCRFTNVSDEGKLFGMQGSSGGYAEYIFRYAAKQLFNVDVGTIEYKNIRGTDLRSFSLDVRKLYNSR